ncbi:ThuA domain-containing protein [Deinococcus radiopugnans]|uniref:Trehalose utilization protein n=1 Tax=Deinococcus radiopugnans ATCC 19172 TaxID=585398 RepID=A0A5C4XLG0_9DEIO|nr:ThuA domain-containing protein [Deinococcus radiopugnans]MBB6018787.1 trehalose utilization protein [Deinococcus radiopugnans ATCC 19172]TNM64238.1 trehalose utilization protein ThuA [Deinococcus radiopugnans ATCC 19172]
MTSPNALRLTVWNEYRHELENPAVSAHYPQGIHAVIAEGLRAHGFESVQTATLDEPEHGLTDEVLNNTDVLLWWGHKAHGDVSDEIAAKVVARVLDGMGLIVLHSGHFSKPFKTLMGTGCDLKWREAGERERLWVVNPAHPIAQGVGEHITLEHEEMYGEHFDIPAPDELVFVSWFAGGEVFRSGCTFTRGGGKIFYFRPGHETFPTYHNSEIQRVIANAARWAMPTASAPRSFGHRPEPLEKL